MNLPSRSNSALNPSVTFQAPEEAVAHAHRLRVAIISNSLPPYHRQLLLRLIRMMPMLHFHSLFTHDSLIGTWTFDPPPELNPVQFGAGEDPEGPSGIRRTIHEWRKGGRIIHWLREHAIEAVVMNGYDDVGRLRIARWCQTRNIPCYVRGDSNIRLEKTRGWKPLVKGFLLTRFLRWYRGAMPVGSLGVEYFRKYGVPADRIYLVPFDPGYDLIESITPQQTRQVMNHYGWDASRRRVLFTGRLIQLKRVDLIIKAFHAIASDRPNWDLVIMGDGELRSQLEAQVPVDLQSRVTWTGFITDQQHLAAVFHACDALVLPSDHERWALVVNEALTAGLAIVASDVVGAAGDLIEEGVNGRTFPRGDLAKFTDALRDVTRDDAIDAMKQSARRIITRWREEHPPEKGLRDALTDAGLL